MQLTRIEITDVNELWITIDNHYQLSKVAILESVNLFINCAFEITQRETLWIESLIYVEAKINNPKANIKQVNTYKDVNGNYLSSHFTQSRIDFHCREEVCNYFLEAHSKNN